MTDGPIRIGFTAEHQAAMALHLIDRQTARDAETRIRFTPEQRAKLATMRQAAEPPPEPMIAAEPPKRTGPIRIKLTAEQAHRARVAAAKRRSLWWA